MTAILIICLIRLSRIWSASIRRRKRMASRKAVREFIELMKKRAELTARKFPFTPSENRDVAMGQISICYELADRAKSALDAKASFATDAEANRIRKEVAAMK